jgi:drug/metabolite transporter (DMT)-like permease
MLKNMKGNLILLLTALIWGTAFVAQRDGMNHIGPYTFNAARTFLAAVVLIPVVLVFKKIEKRSDDYKPIDKKTTILGGIACGACLGVASTLQQIGIVTTTAGKAGFITALYVIIVPIIALILGNKPPKKIWICVILAIVGFYFLCIKSDFSLSSGDAFILACAVGFAVHITVIDSFLEKGADALVMANIQFWTAGILMLVPTFVFETPTIDGLVSARYSILFTGIMSSAVAYTLQIIGQRYTTPAVATLIMSLESVFAALAGWIILGENLSLKELLGCALVFIAVILAQIDLKKIKKPKEKSV